MNTNRLLLARVASLETLQTAWKRIASKGATGGSDGVTVEEFAADIDANLSALRREIVEDRYVPQPLQQVAIPKGPTTTEMRTLRLPAVRDKVAQEAVRSVVEPLLNRIFLDCSYGYRPGKGPHRALSRVSHYLGPLKRRWAVSADVDDFFGSLDQALLVDRLRPVLKDEAVLRLVQLWLKMGAVDTRGRWRDVYSGVCQGGVISPLLANFYLHPLDEFLVGQGVGLVRYADDFLLLCAERRDAEDALVKATSFLETSLALRLNSNPCPITDLDTGFAFLGVTFQGNRRLIEASKLEGKAAKIKRLAESGEPVRAMRTINDAVAGWRRYYGSVVDPAELIRLHEIATNGFVALAARAFRHGTWRSIAEAESALQGIETILHQTPDQRRELILHLVREGRTKSIPAVPPVAQKGPGRHPAGLARPGLGARTGETVAGRVRRAKRQHQRQLAHISELVINTPGSFLGKNSQRVVVRQDRRTVCEVPAFRLTGITVASRGISLSSDLVDHCAEHEIPVLFLSPRGKVTAMLSAPESSRGATGLLQLQALADPKTTLDIAKRFVEGKIRNQMSLLKYLHKYRKRAHPAFGEAFSRTLGAMCERLAELRSLSAAGSFEACRGRLFSVEGRAAQDYWGLLALLFRDVAEFPGRRRQGATDLVNSLLNYGYAILQARVHLAILRAGLSPQISFLHSLQRQGQPTLAFDLMEEFRPQVVDRTVLAILARHEPVAVDEVGLLTAPARDRLIARVHDRLATLIRFRGRDLKIDEVIGHQAALLVRHLKGESRYRPFLAKW